MESVRLLELQHADLCAVATARSELIDAYIAAVHAVVLGSELTEELLNDGMGSFLAACAEFLSGLLVLANEGKIIEVSHDLPASMEL